jgi:ubiquinol oxidase
LERLPAEQLKVEQQKTLSSPRMRYSLLAKALFISMDFFYGRKRSLSKFKVLEVIARVPYQAWEHVAYIAITHTYKQADFAKRIFDRVQESRRQQDNEQWHLLILEEWVHRRGIHENFFLYRIIPQIMAFVYYQISWILYVIKPSLSYRLNAYFEDHAEREYMAFAKERPELESEPFESDFKSEFGDFKTMADVVRQIGYDERVHKVESLEHIGDARFS